MKMKGTAALSITAIVWLLPMGPVSAVVLDGKHADESEGVCPSEAIEMMHQPEGSKTDRDAIEELMAHWAVAVEEADLEALGSLVTEDAEFWTHGAAPLVGRRALIAAFEPFLGEFELHQRFDCKELIVAGRWAFMRGTEVNHLSPRNGGDVVVRRQRAFSVLRRETNGKWLFARGMTNLPPDG